MTDIPKALAALNARIKTDASPVTPAEIAAVLRELEEHTHAASWDSFRRAGLSDIEILAMMANSPLPAFDVDAKAIEIADGANKVLGR